MKLDASNISFTSILSRTSQRQRFKARAIPDFSVFEVMLSHTHVH